jgi:hypothetical protein
MDCYEGRFILRRSGWSLTDPYAQVATMRRWSAADDAASIVAERGRVERVKIWT